LTDVGDTYDTLLMPLSGSILVIEDDRSMREFLEILLRRHRHQVSVAESGRAGQELITQKEFDLVITDLKMPGAGGLEILQHCKRLYPHTEVILVTAFATAETAISAMKQGAYDYLTKPFKVDEIMVTVERALEKRALVRDNFTLREELKARYRLDRLVGRSEPMQELFALIRRVAASRISVLITGESGTGKELVAQAIHSLGDRAERPFVPVNCGAIPDALIESELFGHVRGAFTGATSDHVGLFAAADGGTVFLDEIAELSLGMQVKLLRTLQERTIKPVGAVGEREVDVRILAASNRNLEEEVANNRLRSDLYYRLNVISVRIPPLREREEDVPLLVEHFLRKFAAQNACPVHSVAPEAMALLRAYRYPGNVRELENIIERAVTLAPGDSIDESCLPELRRETGEEVSVDGAPLPDTGLDLDGYVAGLERQLLVQALERCSGSRTAAAALLRISLRSLRYRLAKYGLDGAEERPRKP
jgi:two-component system, NtrC family, response regulator PilR